MQATVSTLLRAFSKIHQAAMRGEEVIIKSREGDLRITAVSPQQKKIIGSLKGKLTCSDELLDKPTLCENEWFSKL